MIREWKLPCGYAWILVIDNRVTMLRLASADSPPWLASYPPSWPHGLPTAVLVAGSLTVWLAGQADCFFVHGAGAGICLAN
jgi:hypothetical protein